MDCEKIGALIRAARRERGMTQRELGEALHISDRTVSKWECAQGCPDVSLLPALSARLGVDLERMLSGDLEPSREKGDSMKRIRFFCLPPLRQCGDSHRGGLGLLLRSEAGGPYAPASGGCPPASSGGGGG